jgi:hypothetical protein
MVGREREEREGGREGKQYMQKDDPDRSRGYRRDGQGFLLQLRHAPGPGP